MYSVREILNTTVMTTKHSLILYVHKLILNQLVPTLWTVYLKSHAVFTSVRSGKLYYLKMLVIHKKITFHVSVHYTKMLKIRLSVNIKVSQ